MRLLAGLVWCAALAGQSGTVTGRIVSATDGQPVKRAIVILAGVPPATESYECQSGADGRFVVKDAAPGVYEVKASRVGFQEKGGQLVTVTAGGDVSGVELRLVPPGAIAGRVVDETGAGVMDARVSAMRYKYSTGRRELTQVKTVETDDRGEYRLSALPQGRWYLRASKPSQDPPPRGDAKTLGAVRERVLVDAYYPGDPDAKRAAPLDVAPGGELQHVDIPMRRGSLYTVRLKVPNNSVFLVQRATGGLNSAVSHWDADTRSIELTGVQPGTYSLTASTPENPGKATRIFPFAVQRVVVTDHDIDNVDLTQANAVEIAGRVQLEGTAGFTADRVSVVLTAEEAGEREQPIAIPVNADGSFRQAVWPDAYIIKIKGPAGAYLKSVRAGDRELADHRLEVVPDTGKLTLTVSNAAGKVEGVVATTDMRALVTLIPDQSLPYWIDLYKTASTSADGAFTISGVAPGDYRIYAWTDSDPDGPMDPDYRKAVEGVPVHLDANATVKMAEALRPAR